MTLRVANGSVLSIAASFGTVKSMTAITNAPEAVATLEASHGVAQGEIIEITSGWDGLNGRVARAKTVATNDVTLEEIDTSSTSLYPAGAGGGSVREISTWAAVSQIRGIERSGGDQQFGDATLLSDLVIGRQVPTVMSPLVLNLTVADDPAMSWIPTVRAAMNSRAVTPGRITTPGGAVIYFNGYWSILEFPTLQAGALMEIQISIALVALPTRYAS